MDDDGGAVQPSKPDSDGTCLTTACERSDDNCAYCGHRCGADSRCIDRTCTPVDVATVVMSGPLSLCTFARDGNRLYVALPHLNDAGRRQTKVHEILPSGELDPTPVLAVDRLARVKHLLAHAERFYLLGPESMPSSGEEILLMCPRTGTECTQLQTLDHPGGLAQSGNRLFATLQRARIVVAVPYEPDASLTTIAQDSTYSPIDIVGDEGAIYWRERQLPPFDGGAEFRVMRLAMSPDGGFGNPQILAETNTNTTALGLDERHVFFGVPGALASVAKTGGPLDLKPIPGREDSPVQLVDVTSDRWFVFAGTPSTLYEGDHCGSSPIAIAVEPTFSPGRAAEFGDHVYWCTSGPTAPVPQSLRRVPQ